MQHDKRYALAVSLGFYIRRLRKAVNMEKWVCNRCGNTIYEKPYKNQTCNENGCKGRFRQYRKCECGEWFKTSAPNKRFCSENCPEKTKHTVKVICHHCGKTFDKYISDTKGKIMMFCCVECYDKYRDSLRENRICKYCGKEFKVYKSSIRSSNATGDYCSRKCCDDAKIRDRPNRYGAGFSRAKKMYFSGVQFCAICGTTKKIQIHHIIPYRMTRDNSIGNLIPLCAKHHMQFEIASRPFLESMDGEMQMAQDMVGGMLRRRQKATHMAIIDLMKRKADADRNS